MVVGFNHNFRYKGQVYHVQTEDGGLKSPNIITLLYRGGNILASKKTSYADICKVDNLNQVVEELMKEQHREMLRRLKDGDLDAVIEGRMTGISGTEPKAEVVAPPPPQQEPAEPQRNDAAPASSLDEIILSYLVGDDEAKDAR